MSTVAEYFVGMEFSSTASCPFQLDISFLDSSAWPLWRDGEEVCYPDFPIGSDRIGGIIFGAWEFGDGLGPGSDGNVGPGDLAFLHELTERTRRFDIVRGRDTNMDAIDMGQAQIVIKDPDGDLNPMNPESPFFPTVRPGKRAAILMKHAGDWEGMFYGLVRDIEWHPDDYETVITVVDDFYRLSRVEPKVPAHADNTVGELLHYLCEQSGLTNDKLRQFDDGPAVRQFVSKGDKSSLALIQSLLELYRGAFFVDRNGVLRWIDIVEWAGDLGTSAWQPDANNGSIIDLSPNQFALRKTRTTYPDLGPLLAAKKMRYAPAASLDNLRNEITVKTDVNGTQSEQVVSDAESINLYGVLSASYDIEGDYVYDPQQLEDLAAYLLGLWRGLNPPIRSLSFIANESDDLMAATEIVDIGSLAHVEDELGAIDEFMIQSVRHRVETGSLVHEVIVTLSRTIGEELTSTTSTTSLGRGLEI